LPDWDGAAAAKGCEVDALSGESLSSGTGSLAGRPQNRLPGRRACAATPCARIDAQGIIGFQWAVENVFALHLA
jgi:hypothetical protein